MSSHHIVREKQEPALYIHRLGNFSEEYLGQLLEWSPTVIVAADEYEKVISLGLKIDMVIGDTKPEQAQENTKWLNLGKNDLVAVIQYLVQEEYPAVNIIGEESKFDDLADLLPRINVVLFTETTKSYPIKQGFSIWKPAGTVFKVDIINYFETENLKQVDNGDFVVIKDGFVSFAFTTDYMFLSELL